MPTQVRKFAVHVALLAASLAATAQQKINPITQINWPVITGSGTPQATNTSCVPSGPNTNVGQPYINLASYPNTSYACGSTGWFLTSGSVAPIVYTGTWSGSTTYTQNNAAFFGGSQYISLQNGNLNHTPNTSPSFWALLVSGGGATIAVTSGVIKGDGAGNGIAATPGTDFVVPSGNVATANALAAASALPNGTTATTQTVGDNTTKVATDAFVLANQGAGATSNPATCTANSTGNKCLGVAPYVAVSGDWTTAIQTAINNLASEGGGTLWVPCHASYPVNGALQDTGGANAVIVLPPTPLVVGTTTPIRIEGLCNPNVYGGVGAATIQTSVNTASANFIGGYVSSGPYGGFINTDFVLENIVIATTATNPAMTMVSAKFFPTAQLNNVVISSAAPGTPAATTGTGYISPVLSNNVSVSTDHLTVVGFYALTRFSEHMHVGHIEGANSHLGYVFDTEPGTDPSHSTWGNTVSVDYMWCQLCDYMVSAATSQTTINIQALDAEVTTTAIVNDPSNLLKGEIHVNVPYADGRSTSTPTAFVNNGGTGLNICNLKTAACSLEGGGGAALPVTPMSLTGMVENWGSQEGAGSILANSGTDYTNTATTSSVSWSTAAGFTGKVATYNGTSSFALASSTASNSNFAGNQPFSMCSWFNMTASPANASYSLISNLATSVGVGPGIQFVFSTLASGNVGQLGLFLSNNVTTSIMHVDTAITIPANGLHLGCVVYHGDFVAANVEFYLDGASMSTTVESNTLGSNSIASTAPMFLGCIPNTISSCTGQYFQGALGRAAIFIRALSAVEVSNIYQAGSAGCTACGGEVGAVATPVAAPNNGLSEHWLGQEGQGTVQPNAGYDLANPVTSSNVTYGSSSGFTGNVATYNGTSSFGLAANNTNTNFDGSLPFSMCSWFNMTASPANASYSLISNLALSVGVGPGIQFVFSTLASGNVGQLGLFLSNNVSTSIMHVDTAITIPANGLHFGCVVYHGDFVAANVQFYLDGASMSTTVESNTLGSNSITSTAPMFLGCIPDLIATCNGQYFKGALAYNKIYNRALTQADVTALYSIGPRAF